MTGFPAWAEAHWGLPNYTVQRWLIHNYFFLGAQLAVFSVYLAQGFRNTFLGLGIILWGLINTVNHLVFALMTMCYAPGLLTCAGFILLGVSFVRVAGPILLQDWIKGALVAIAVWVLPAVLFISFDIFVLKLV